MSRWRREGVGDENKRYENYGQGEGSQLIPLCNTGRKFHMTDLSALVTKLLNSYALEKQLNEYIAL